ncbi:hypothetical protein SAMN05192559_107187 [Halobacillus karajensis]|uniref:hypothetical protein n=1 Tax=Halobacillus karajensis TaxID=195088 RepID=UPI0008A760FF|nr:hypothetical protein [Halobacillus karajensis]SEI02254.1 hypothetical protein SAMN05192559_107187 [Halobacillus karajensis]
MLSINQEEAISACEQVMENAKGSSQAVDVMKETPDHDIMIRYEKGGTQGLHLLLGNAGEESILLYTGHETNGFIVAPKDPNEIRKLLNV